jgi:hypothetical protein
MTPLWRFPGIVLLFSFVVLWLATEAGVFFRNRSKTLGEAERNDLGVIVPASLTLLGLIIGFSFSMSIGRYDLRKNYEEEEANAIGTEYARTDLLPAADAEKVRALLKSYLDQRLIFYTTRDADQLKQNDTVTEQLQAKMWTATVAPAVTHPSALTALATSGMNDVLNSEGYALAAWRNTIPRAAWILMETIAALCSVLIGYNLHRKDTKYLPCLILPFLVAISFFLIADIDSPRRGVVEVLPQNLQSLAQSLHVR